MVVCTFDRQQRIFLITLLKGELSSVQEDIKILEDNIETYKLVSLYEKSKNLLKSRERYINNLIKIIEGED